MKKKHHHKKKGHRNNGDGDGPPPRPRPPRPPRSRSAGTSRHAPRPDWKTIGAAIIGGAGGAALGGLIVNQRVLSPEAVGLGLVLGGGATAYFADGTTRVVGTSLAAAGAGQLALTLMARQAVKSAMHQHDPHAPASQARSHSGQPAAQLPAPPSSPPPPPPPPPVDPRQSAHGGGLLVDLFQDVATDMDLIEDEWRFGVRDEPRDAAEPFVIDLDEAA
jgi:hypothetical protein